jgi:hypothetical protein
MCEYNDSSFDDMQPEAQFDDTPADIPECPENNEIPEESGGDGTTEQVDEIPEENS